MSQTSPWKLRSYWPKKAKHGPNGIEVIPLQIKRPTTDSVKTLNRNFFESYVSNLNRYDNSLWNPLKSARKPVSPNPPLCINSPTQNRWAHSDKEKADAFAKHLEDVFKPQEEGSDDELPECLQPPTQPVTSIQPVTPKELKTTISLLHTRKAPGIDLITPTMLKELPHKVILTY